MTPFTPSAASTRSSTARHLTDLLAILIGTEFARARRAAALASRAAESTAAKGDSIPSVAAAIRDSGVVSVVATPAIELMRRIPSSSLPGLHSQTLRSPEVPANIDHAESQQSTALPAISPDRSSICASTSRSSPSTNHRSTSPSRVAIPKRAIDATGSSHRVPV